MLAHYINLKAATARRARLEAQVQALPPGQWVLQRFEAIDAHSDECRLAQGRISQREKGCFLSHKALLTRMIITALTPARADSESRRSRSLSCQVRVSPVKVQLPVVALMA
jgi:hypothetical protein